MGAREVLRTLERLDSRYLFVLVFIVTAFPLVFPLGIPVKISAPVQKSYDAIEALAPNSVVLIGDEFSAPSWTELGPSYIAVLKHLIRKNIRLVFVSFFSAEAPAAFDTMIKPRVDFAKLKYGVDFVELGFVAGGEAALASFASDIQRTLKVDRYGASLSELGLTKDLRITHFSLVVELDPGAHLSEYLRQLQAPYGLRHISITYGVTAPAYTPYLLAGQLSGMLVAIRGGAEYELLIKEPGVAVSGVDGVSTSHVLFAICLVAGSFLSLVNRLLSKEGKGK